MEEDVPGTAIFLELYKGKVQCHVWDGTKGDHHKIVLQ